MMRLRKTLPTWQAVLQAPVETVAEAIRPGGLAESKAPRIQAIMRQITEERSIVIYLPPPYGPDKVKIELSPYDLARGRIIFRER